MTPRPGGQPGHDRHERTPFSPEQVDRAWIYEWPDSALSSDCEPLEEFHSVPQVDLVKKLVEVTEHRARLYRRCTTGEVAAAGASESGPCWPPARNKAARPSTFSTTRSSLTSTTKPRPP
jgi:hypothetical protein